MIQIGKILKKVPIFRMLGKESIDFIVERLKFKTFQSGEIICKTVCRREGVNCFFGH